MRKGFLVGAAVVAAFVVWGVLTAQAAPTSFPICTANGSQEDPDVHGRWVVWQDFRNTTETGWPDLYGYDLSALTEFPVRVDSQICQHDPDIFGDIVVWSDQRNWQTSGNDIYRKQLPSGPETLVCNAWNDQMRPAIHGDWVAWEDSRNYQGWYAEIFAKNLTTGAETQVSNLTSDDTRVDIYYPWVVWEQDAGFGTYVCASNLSTGEFLLVTNPPGIHRSPSIWGDKIVWMEYSQDTWDIYAFDLTSRTEFPVCAARANQYMPRIYENIVVWEDWRFKVAGGSDIVGKDLATGREFAVSVGEPGRKLYPAIHGATVVWQDYRNWSTTGSDIYGADISPAEPGERHLWLPLDSAAPPGATVTVPVSLDDLSGLAGVQFDLTYCTGLLTLLDVRKGAGLPEDWGLEYESLPTPGELRVVAYSPSSTELPGGSGAVVEIDFAVGGVPGEQCSLDPNEIVLSDEMGLLVGPVTGAGGLFTVLPPVHHFSFWTIESPQGGDDIAPLPFTVHVEAVDEAGNPVTSYDRTAELAATAGVPDPALITFTGGVWDGAVRVYADLDPACALMATDPAIPASGTSSDFNLRGKGDPTDDGIVNVLDVVRTVRVALGLPVPEPPRYEFQLWAGDMDCSDAVNVLDVIQVVNKSLGRSPLAMASTMSRRDQAAPIAVHLVQESRGVWAVQVSDAQGLAGAQLELAVRCESVSAGELAANAGWTVQSNEVNRHLRVIAYNPSGTALDGAGGVLLRLSGVKGRPKLSSILLSDGAGHPIQVRQ